MDDVIPRYGQPYRFKRPIFDHAGNVVLWEHIRLSAGEMRHHTVIVDGDPKTLIYPEGAPASKETHYEQPAPVTY